MNRVFIIEDDIHLAEGISFVLNKHDYKACYCKNLLEWESELELFQPNILLLDINLQITNGFSICSKLRQKNRIPIIFITGRDAEEDEIRALNIGGDDYLKKPFSDEILLAHVERQLKVHSFEYRDNMSYRNLELNLGKRMVINNTINESVELSGMEFQILFYLMGRAEFMVSRDEITDYLWNNRCYIDENALNVNLSRLRNKLSQISAADMLMSVKGEGLCLCCKNI